MRSISDAEGKIKPAFLLRQPYLDRVIPKDHFLKLLDKAVDFSFVSELCRDAYTPDFSRPAYGPDMMFKIIFLQFLYDVSDRRIEEEVNFNLVLNACQRITDIIRKDTRLGAEGIVLKARKSR